LSSVARITLYFGYSSPNVVSSFVPANLGVELEIGTARGSSKRISEDHTAFGIEIGIIHESSGKARGTTGGKEASR